jgi:hypothetical protein
MRRFIVAPWRFLSFPGSLEGKLRAKARAHVPADFGPLLV